MEIARDAGKATGNVSTAEITDATPAGAELAHLPARVPGPDRHAHDLPDGGQDGRAARPRLDRRAAGRRGLRPLPRRRARALHAAADGRRHHERHRLRAVEGLHVRRHQAGARRRHRAARRCSACSTTSNMTTEFAPLFARTAAYYAANPNRDVQVQGGSETTRCQPQNRGDEPSLPEMTTQGALAARGRQGRLRAPGRGRLDRQARPRRRRLRPDRRDAGVRQRRRRRARLPGPAPGHARDRHRRPLAHVADDVHDRRARPPARATRRCRPSTTRRSASPTAPPTPASGATTSGSQHHTGAEVPVWARGPRAADIQGTIDQTDIFSVLTNVRGPAGAADTTQVAPVGGSVPATLGADRRRARRRSRAFQPGAARDYTASTTANVISSAGDATLSVGRPERTRPGGSSTGRSRSRSRCRSGPRRAAFAPLGGLDATLLSLRGAGVQRRGDDRLQPVDRRQRGAAHRHLRQDAHVHALDHEPVAVGGAEPEAEDDQRGPADRVDRRAARAGGGARRPRAPRRTRTRSARPA